MLTTCNAIGDAGRSEAESHTAARQPVQHLWPCKQQREDDTGGGNEKDVERDAHIGRQRADSGDDRADQISGSSSCGNTREARAARRVVLRAEAFLTLATLVAFAALARASTLVRFTRQRSRAFSTLSSMVSETSPVTSAISETTRNLARSSIRFSRNERFFDLLRKLRLLQDVNHVTDRTGPHLVRVVFEAALPVLVAVDLPIANPEEEPPDLGIGDRAAQSDVVYVIEAEPVRSSSLDAILRE